MRREIADLIKALVNPWMAEGAQFKEVLFCEVVLCAQLVDRERT